MTMSPARGLPMRVRLFLLPAVPAVLLAAATGAGVADLAAARAGATAAVRHVDLALAAEGLVHALQEERALATGLAAGDDRFAADLIVAGRATDAARAALTPLLAGRAGAEPVREALAGLSTPAEIRASGEIAVAPVPEPAGSPSGAPPRHLDVFTSYTRTIAVVLDASHPAGPLEALARGEEAAAQERALVTGAFAAGSFAAADHAAFLRAGAVEEDALTRYRRLAGPPGRAALDRALRTGPVARIAALEQEAVASVTGSALSAGPRAWHSATAARADALRDAQRTAGAQARAAARAAVERETRRLVTLAAAGTALVLILLVLGMLLSRSIVRPLRNLATEAGILRDHAAELESGVREPGTDPARADAFTEVALAVGGMHGTAVRLAAERTALRAGTAEALAELGRRNRDLVHRQLGAVGVLQRHESDQAALARLCELDRLTGRLRRNAESLLVLAGKRAARRSSEPVPVADVVRLTLAEMEGHHRVTLRVLDGPLVRGAVVAEVAHLLAELVENALAFSPPDSEVEIWARADEGECRITITDHGVGMTTAELATANARLRGEESFLAAPARCLAHHVVGRLAERLGVRVWLHESLRCGVTARVALPEELLTASAAVERVAQP
ncbi:sensor histidine kinase [Nonomuraea sp. SBT364]|uniref:sensor histidine kinase n=1 Tax=Nonomuraea sp. SBT364 TaxID=1580530 RepID=UPI00066EAC45|nr:ATP-binding protein [Nonomuraea sp. SBT364]